MSQGTGGNDAILTKAMIGKRVVAQWLSKMPECRWEASETFDVTVVCAGA